MDPRIKNPPAATRTVLVHESPNQLGMRIAAELRRFSGSHRLEVLTTSRMEAALHVIRSRSIAMAVIDVGRESGEAASLLRSLGRTFPSLPLFVFNGFMMPGIAEKAKEYDHVRYCEDSGELNRFISLILESLAPKKRGMIEGILLTNFLHWLNSEKLSGWVMVSSGGRRGSLSMKDGRLVAADLGNASSSTALAEMSAWEKVTVEIHEGASENGAAGEATLAASGIAASPRVEDSPIPASVRPGGNIEELRLTRMGTTVVVRIDKLKMAAEVIRDMLPDSLQCMDVFLSSDGRSLAGWNSHPLACSAFAVISSSLQQALTMSGFPRLGKYYLLDLMNGQVVMIVLCGELQMGMLVGGKKEHLGLLTNVVLAKALKFLSESCRIEHPS
ncbi:MAG: DUF4388 domain-containing protein [Candidatus Aminicenantes bacterium]|nr:DUF4388 domain-containing protein [Candidatus Aminicenantes bacterium]